MTIDPFDLAMGNLDGLPDVTQTRAVTIRTVTPVVGLTQTFIIQTFRQRDIGDTIFIEHISPSGTSRIVLGPKVADTISRQRDSLTTVVRRKVGKATMAERMAGGWKPDFGGKRGAGRKRKRTRKAAK